jgi:hypothetical protein
LSINQQVAVGPNGDKPQRKMREAAISFKSDLQSGKELDIVDTFVLKLPDVSSHKFHITEGEVHTIGHIGSVCYYLKSYLLNLAYTVTCIVTNIT